MLIINADDLGLDERTNRAIIQSFRKGLCSSTTLMPNMPGFGEACELIHENRLENHTGMHLVLTEGYPLSAKIRYLPRLCDKEGRLCLSMSDYIPIFWLESQEKEAIAEETIAQIRRCRDHGIPITHIDSHNSAHVRWAITSVLIPIVIEQRIPYVRITRNCGPNLGTLKKAYKYIFNYKLRTYNLALTRYFGSVEDFVFLKNKIGSPNGMESFEVMIHPSFNDKQILVDRTNDMLLELEEVIKDIDSYEDAVSFKGVKYL